VIVNLVVDQIFAITENVRIDARIVVEVKYVFTKKEGHCVKIAKVIMFAFIIESNIIVKFVVQKTI